jgi:hypothetical protein
MGSPRRVPIAPSGYLPKSNDFFGLLRARDDKPYPQGSLSDAHFNLGKRRKIFSISSLRQGTYLVKFSTGSKE